MNEGIRNPPSRQTGDDSGVLLPVTSNLVDGPYGYVNTKGRMVIEPRYYLAREFSEGLAAVRCWDHDRQCCRWGFIDPQGKWAIPPRLKWATSFASGQAWVKTVTCWVLIDRKGQVIQSLPEKIQIFSELSDLCPEDPIIYSQTAAWIGHPHLSQGGWFWQPINKYGLLSPAGDLLTDPYLDSAGSFGQGLALVRLRGRMGYMDSEGRVVTGWLRILRGFAFSEGLAAVQAWDRRWGFIDTAGKTVIPPRFEEAVPFQEGLAPVKRIGQDNWEIIDPAGQTVVQLNQEIKWVGSFSEGLAAVKINGSYCCIDTKGNLVFPPLDFSISDFHQGYAEAFVGLVQNLYRLAGPDYLVTR